MAGVVGFVVLGQWSFWRSFGGVPGHIVEREQQIPAARERLRRAVPAASADSLSIATCTVTRRVRRAVSVTRTVTCGVTRHVGTP